MECGCGSGPTGKCIGWHALSEEEYQNELKNCRWKRREKILAKMKIKKPAVLMTLLG
jgi:hypothetical protein